MNITVKFLTILLVTGILVVQTFVIARIFKDNRRLTDNFATIIKGTEYYRINDSISAARSERILLDNAEIKAYFPEIKSTVEQLDVKLRQLERYSAINSAANYEIATKIEKPHPNPPPNGEGAQNQPVSASPPLGDYSLSLRENASLSLGGLQYTRYHDKWLDFQQAIVADSAYTAIQTRDSIAIVQSWQRPHKFWFVHWGRKRHIQTVTNANPHATITYSVYVEKQ